MSEVEYNNMSSRQMEFAVFCVGCVEEALNRPATEVYDLLKNSGMFYHSTTFQLLQEGIADLHCRSDLYLADELMMEYP